MEIYHISSRNSNGKILTPRIPKNFFTNNGFEEDKTPRVCFAKSIDGALAALSQNLENKELFIHVPCDNIKYTNAINVPDSKITKEVWVKEPVKIKCIGVIKVSDAIDKPYEFTYGGKYKAELYYWKWRWIKKFNNMDKLNKYINEYFKEWSD